VQPRDSSVPVGLGELGPDCRDLSLAELGELVEQFPQIDWSSAIEAAARDERKRAATVARM
jgi:hypothetical protein